MTFDYLISIENIIFCWDQFKRGKRNKLDVMHFERHLEDNIFLIHTTLRDQSYRHGPYAKFYVHDPKRRLIAKASVGDRLVHHILFNALLETFEPTFIFHSYSSRFGKGTHAAVRNLHKAIRKVSRNYTSTAFALKCDIRHFFASIRHQKLLEIIAERVRDERLLWLIETIVKSDSVLPGWEDGEKPRGLPIGNVTSQIFSNIYLNKLDWYIKKELRVRHYFRYADDFIIIHHDKQFLEDVLSRIRSYIERRLALELHPSKTSIRKIRPGVDFLGYVVLPHYIALRTTTKRRMLTMVNRKAVKRDQGIITEQSFQQSLQSYLGMLKHCNGYKIRRKLMSHLPRLPSHRLCGWHDNHDAHGWHISPPWSETLCQGIIGSIDASAPDLSSFLIHSSHPHE